VHSVEALLRWRRHDGSLAHTGNLIELIETTGAIRDVTLWTLRQAIGDSKRLFQEGHDLTIFINMSGGLLSDTTYCQSVQKLVESANCNIGIEITETAVINDPATAIENLREFARAGISVAIDDFGAGLSSLEYLQQLPACELKIDRGFIAKLSSSNRNPLIVKATIDLAHALEMKVTAEGVDDPLGLALLKVMGCDMAQGYLVSPPLPVANLAEYLAENDRLLSLEVSIDDTRQGIV
jgi:diguanylate cyclase